MPRRVIDNQALYSLSFVNTGTTTVVETSPVNIPAVGAANSLIAVFKTINPSETRSIFQYYNANNEEALKVRGGFLTYEKGGGSILCAGTTKIKANTWYVAVSTFDGTTNKLYLNAVLEDSNLKSHNSASTTTVRLSTYNGSGEPLNGNAKTVAIYNRALTATEVSQITFNNIFPSNGKVLHWGLNDGTGSTVTDSSGNGNHGTITGATWSTDVPSKARTSPATRVAIDNEDKASLSFDGDNDSIVVNSPSSNMVITGDVTIVGIVKKTGTGGNPFYILDFSDAAETEAANVLYRLGFQSVAGKNVFYWFHEYGSGSNVPVGGTTGLSLAEWSHVAVVRVDSEKKIYCYLNGVLHETLTYSTSATGGTSGKVWVGLDSSTTSDYKGLIKSVAVFNRALSATEILSLSKNKIYPSGTVLRYDLNEGTGTTAYDSSGNGNNGTITGATWSDDIPSQERKEVNGNLVKNGDFEYAPPFVAAQTATNWMDGSAAGSASNKLFRWRGNIVVASAEVKFDSEIKYSGNNSIKLSTTNASGRVRFSQGVPVAGASALVSELDDLIKVKPNTEYKYSVMVKTSLVANNSVWIQADEYGGTGGARIAFNQSSKLSGTNDWRLLSVTFTTNASTEYVNISGLIDVGGNGQSAWFDDIDLRPTTPTTRQPI